MKYVPALFAAMLLGGCSNSVEVTDFAPGEPTVEAAASEPAAQTPVTESVPDTEQADSPLNAAALLATSLKAAKANDKRVIVHLGAPWCGWCKELETFLATNASLFADDYIVLKLDVEEMEHGGKIARELRGDRTGGIPWITILDADGAELVTSDGPSGNIGCPVTEEERAYFALMIEKTTRHAPAGRIAEVSEALKLFAEKRR